MEKFVVSARKYRPDNFKSVVGQEHITSTLVNAIARGQLSHAYLFCGPRGVGKTTCARIIAKAINCLNPTAEHEACGECDSCRAFADNASFNIYELDAASNNSVDNIRSLTEQVRIPPQVGKYSIYIIDEVHMLTTAAFNAFLKTLEEPPSYVIFILATTEKHKILPTILSRCQIYEFKHISVGDVVGYLKYIASNEGVTYDDESLHVIAQKADGCMRDALSMFDKVVTFCNSQLSITTVAAALNILDYDTYFTFVDTLAVGDYQSALVAFDDVLKRGFDSQTFLSGLSRHLRDLLVARSPSTIKLLGVTDTLEQRYVAQAKSLSPAFIFGAIDIISESENNIKYSLNQRLVAEMSALKICNMSSGVFASQVVAAQQNSAQQPALQPVQPVQPVQQPASQPIVQQSAQQQTIKQQAVSQAVDSQPILVQQPEAVSQDIQQQSPLHSPSIEHTQEEQSATTTLPKPADASTSATSNSSTNGNGISGGGKSSLGLPRLNQMKNSTQLESKELSTEVVEERVDIENYVVLDSDKERVLEGCKIFASKIKDRNPRISLAFDAARVEEGKLIIPVPIKILADEINQKKSQTMAPLSRYAGVTIYDFTVLVETAPREEKKILIRSEDKYKHLLEENPELHKLTETMSLDFY